MKKEPSAATDRSGRWTVEFIDFRVQNEHQRRVIESLERRALLDVVKIWLNVITPGAKIIEQGGTAIWTIVFPTRSQARHFRTCFDGKPISASPP
jgi:hypothetical protein